MKFSFSLVFIIGHFLLSAQDCKKATELNQQALQLIEQDKLEDVLPILQTSYKICPANDETLLHLGDYFMELLVLDSADFYFKTYLHRKNDNALAYRKISGVQFYKQQFDSCHFYLNKALQLQPNDSIALFNKGETYFRQRNWKEAEHYFKLAQQREGYDYTASFRLIDVWLIQGKTKECWVLVEELKGKNPDHYDLLLTESQLLIQENNLDLAVKKIERAKQIDSVETAAYFLHARIFEKIGDNLSALDQYNRIIKLDPHNGDAYLQRAYLLVEMNNNEYALMDFKEALHFDSSLVEAFHQIGIIYYQQSLYQNAADAIQQYLNYFPNDADAWFNAGNAYYALLNYEEAISYYSRAIELDKIADYYYNRALVYYAQEKYGQAITDLTAYIVQEPADSEAYYIRCLSYRMIKQSKEACTDCNMAQFLGKKDIPKNISKECQSKKKKNQ